MEAVTMDAHEEVSNTTDQGTKWMVAYAKVSLDKDDGVELQGIYFGGISDSQEEAEIVARECVNTIKGGTIMPKIMKVTNDFSVIDALYEAADRFESTTKRMQDAESILRRNKK